MLKAVLALTVLQTGLIAFLLIDRGAAGPRSDPVVPAGQPEAGARGPLAHGSREALSPESPLSEQALRRIVREELADRVDRILLEREAAVDTEMPTQARPNTPDALDEPAPADPYEVEHVSQQIDYFVSVGSITSSEMSRLQSDIARLAGAERERLLRKVVAALNSGQLKGRF
jgi:hypothetical protein